jgi:hypothetical protein
MPFNVLFSELLSEFEIVSNNVLFEVVSWCYFAVVVTSLQPVCYKTTLILGESNLIFAILQSSFVAAVL